MDLENSTEIQDDIVDNDTNLQNLDEIDSQSDDTDILDETDLPDFNDDVEHANNNVQDVEYNVDPKDREIADLKSKIEEIGKRDSSSELVAMIKEEKENAIAEKKRKKEQDVYKLAHVKYPERVDDISGAELKSIVDMTVRNMAIEIFSYLNPELNKIKSDILSVKADNTKNNLVVEMRGVSNKDRNAINKYISDEGLTDIPNRINIAKTVLGIKKGTRKNVRYLGDEYGSNAGSARRVNNNNNRSNNSKTLEDRNADLVLKEMRDEGFKV